MHVGGGDLDLGTGDAMVLRAGQHNPARERALLGPGHAEVADQLGFILDGDFFILRSGRTHERVGARSDADRVMTRRVSRRAELPPDLASDGIALFPEIFRCQAAGLVEPDVTAWVQAGCPIRP